MAGVATDATGMIVPVPFRPHRLPAGALIHPLVESVEGPLADALAEEIRENGDHVLHLGGARFLKFLDEMHHVVGQRLALSLVVGHRSFSRSSS